MEFRPEKVGYGYKLAIHGLDPGMTAEWMLPYVLITTAGTIESTSLVSRFLINGRYQQINDMLPTDHRPPTTDHRSRSSEKPWD